MCLPPAPSKYPGNEGRSEQIDHNIMWFYHSRGIMDDLQGFVFFFLLTCLLNFFYNVVCITCITF